MKKRLFALMLCSMLGVSCLAMTACGSNKAAEPSDPPAAEATDATAADQAKPQDVEADAKEDEATDADAKATDPANLSSDDPTGTWTVTSVTHDGGSTLEDDGVSTLDVAADGSAVLKIDGATTKLAWEFNEDDGEGCFYYFTGDEINFIGYIFDDDPGSFTVGQADDSSYILALTR